MAMHGKIELNGIQFGYWEAVRREPTLIKDFNTYDCYVEYRDVEGRPFAFDFPVEHRYGEGALALAAAVLGIADEKLNMYKVHRERR